MKTTQKIMMPKDQFKINLVGTNEFVGRKCGAYTAGIDYGKTWTLAEAEEAVRDLEQFWGKLRIVAA